MHIVHIIFHYIFYKESLLNIHKDVRTMPLSWVTIVWLPVIYEGKSRRPTGYEGSPAGNLNARIFHDCRKDLWVNELNSSNKFISSLVMA